VLAYRQADYRVVDREFIGLLRIGEASDDLRAIFRCHAVDCAAFITACNPLGQRVSEAANRDAMDRLCRTATDRGIAYLAGLGTDPAGLWEGEPSLLLLGLPREAAAGLGREYAQNAIVWAGGTCVPELVLLR
jgi:hypothetical protein